MRKCAHRYDRRCVELVLALAAFFASPVFADPLPAVSSANGRASVTGGSVDGAFGFLGAGSWTVPITENIGGQLEAVGGKFDKDFGGVGGIGGHLFMRNPSEGAIGFSSNWTRIRAIDFASSGVTGERYLGNWTVGGQFGVQYGDLGTKFTSFGRVTFYPTENVMLTGGHMYASNIHFGFAEIEWQPSINNHQALSVFALGTVAEGGTSYIGGGLRWHFGAHPKSLIRRHREDIFDPMGATPINYGLIAALEAVAIIVAVNAVGRQLTHSIPCDPSNPAYPMC